jgi:hypothetical protein
MKTYEQILKEADERREPELQEKGECTHQHQVAILTESGEQTNEYECALCHRRFQIPDGPTYDQL